jgi:hypothetical protein
MKEAVKYLGWLGRPKRVPRDGPSRSKNDMDRTYETIYSVGLPGVPRVILWGKFGAEEGGGGP